jgi:energy-coupling factor transporter ATP-binding protein EcfA2
MRYNNVTRRIISSRDLETEKIGKRPVMKPLAAKRILVCGKGGSGKSSLTARIAPVLRERQFGVVLVDGDASNPGGLTRLVLGGVTAPKPPIEFFGGREELQGMNRLTMIFKTLQLRLYRDALLRIEVSTVKDENDAVQSQMGAMRLFMAEYEVPGFAAPPVALADPAIIFPWGEKLLWEGCLSRRMRGAHI